MKQDTLLGLLECPTYNGWIEFMYTSGDRISDLVKSIEARWGKKNRKNALLSMYPKAWAFFCEQTDGAYLSLKNSDPIPVEAPSPSEETIYPDADTDLAVRILERDNVLDVYFLGQYWEIKDETPIQPLANYSMELPFKRQYEVPKDRQYAIKLLALAAIVGG